ncbi:MAG: hypothetical protein WC527_07365 [Candidatus Margulisiibacteriota bacterium]
MAKNEVLEVVKRLETRMNIGFEELNGKIDNVDNRLEDFRKETIGRFDHVFNKLDFHNTEYHSITYGMRRIEDEHRIINHAEILKEINALKASK